MCSFAGAPWHLVDWLALVLAVALVAVGALWL